jgi:hypothetical protein
MWYIHIILSNTKAGRGAWNHIFLPNIGVGACALSALAHFVYDNSFICIDLWSYIFFIFIEVRGAASNSAYYGY